MQNMLPKNRPGQQTEERATTNDYTYGGRNTFFYSPQNRIVFPSAKFGVKGRILPSFDFSLNPQDEAFATSFVAYRDRTVVDPETDHPVWTYWYYDRFDVYRFWGPENRAFFSPRVVSNFGDCHWKDPQAFDPINQLNYKLRQDKVFAERWEKYVWHTVPNMNATPDNKPVLVAPAKMALMNFYGSYGEEEERSNFLLGVTHGGMQYICAQLNKGPRPGTEEIDSDWPEYMAGDITAPSRGLLVWSSQRKLGTAGKDANTLVFSDKEDFLKGHKVARVSEEVLSKRVNFFDRDSTIRIMKPQEVADFLVSDTNLPLEMLKEASNDVVSYPASRGPRSSAPAAAPKKKSDDWDDDTPAAKFGGPPPGSKRPAAETVKPAAGSDPDEWDAEGEEDDIPFDKAPSASPAGDGDSSEREEYEQLEKRYKEGSLASDVTALVRYFSLAKKFA
jgi:hypothetical protein